MQTIATLKEVKDNENRVGLTPQGVKELKKNGHRVIVQTHCGIGAGFSDVDYIQAGAEIMKTAEEIVQECDILTKVKEPIPAEYHLLDLMNGKTIYTYFHLSGVDKKLTEKLIENKISAIAYETIEDETGHLPLLAPMSEVAGVLAIQYAAQYLQKKYNGLGITMGHISGTDRASVVIVGAGVVGRTSAKTAAGLGSNVLLFDINDEVINQAEEDIKQAVGEKIFSRVKIIKSTPEIFEEAIKNADVLVGAVLIAGAKAPKVVNEEQVKTMKKGAIIIDVAIDQGGCIWGSKATTHSNPVYEIEGINYCCVANMPGQAAKQATQALTNTTFPYLLQMANEGVIQTLSSDQNFAKGLNTYAGKITFKAVAKDLNMNEYYQAFNELVTS